MSKPVSIRHLFASTSNHLRLEEAARHFESLPDGAEVVVLAPTRGAADDFVRASASRRGVAFGVHRMTLVQLAAALATERLAQKGLAPLSRLGAEALAARAVHICRQAEALGYFSPVVDTPGFPRALASTLGELRLERIDAKRLAKIGDAGRDLARLLNSYAAELAAQSLADLAAILETASDVARQARNLLLGLPLVLLDVAAESALEREFLQALVDRSPSVVATLLAGDQGEVERLEQVLGLKAVKLDDDSSPLSSLGRLRRYVFEPEIPPGDKLDTTVEFFSAPGEGLECGEIARRIRTAADSGVPFDRTAILVRDADAYLPLVEDALRRAEVPAYFTAGTIRPDPSGRAFLALLDCAAEGLSASKFAEYLSLGQVPVVDEMGAPPEPAGVWVASEDEVQLSFRFPTGSAGILPAESSQRAIRSGQVELVGSEGRDAGKMPALPDETDESPVIEGTLRAPFGWEKLLIDAAVIGGKDRWARRLKGLRAEYNLQLKQLQAEEEPERERILKQLARLDNLERFALPMVAFLDSLPRSALWGDWLPALKKLAEMALRQPESVLAVLAELEPMDAVGPVEAGDVRQILTDRLSFLRREPPLRRYGRVFVGSIGEIAGRSFDIVFLPGLAEGLFPRKPSEDPLLLDDHREKLSPALPTQDKRMEREQLLLRGAIAGARSRLCASYPRMDAAQGRERVASFYALEVLRAAEGRLPGLGDLRARAAAGAESRLGWPAPKDPSHALDPAEYDLAVLEPLLHKPPEEVKGHGAYLLEASDCLQRSLRTRWKRWDDRWWPDADGLLQPDAATLEALARHQMPARSYSPSALQHYAACPYQFLLYAIHRLKPREESAALERLDPLTRGGLFHEVQFRFFSALRAARLIPVSQANLDRVTDLGDEVFEDVANEYEEKLAPAIPQVWKSELEDLRIDLHGWIRQLVAIHAEWTPFHFEYAFGLPAGPARETERDPESVAGDVKILEGVRLRGSMDLVEQHRVTNNLRVTDHKTGRAPWPEPRLVGKGAVLQPLLYALAAEKLFQRPVKSGVLYYCTQRGGYRTVEIPLSGEGRMRIEQVLKTIGKAIETGAMLAAPATDACKMCDYQSVCGPYEERRIREKKTRLDDLEDLRCLG